MIHMISYAYDIILMSMISYHIISYHIISYQLQSYHQHGRRDGPEVGKLDVGVVVEVREQEVLRLRAAVGYSRRFDVGREPRPFIRSRSSVSAAGVGGRGIVCSIVIDDWFDGVRFQWRFDGVARSGSERGGARVRAAGGARGHTDPARRAPPLRTRPRRRGIAPTDLEIAVADGRAARVHICERAEQHARRVARLASVRR